MALENLSFENVEMDAPEPAHNPFFDIVEQTYKTGTPKGTWVHVSEVVVAERRLRSAATQLDIGIKIRKSEANDSGMVQIKFCGKEKRPRKSPKKNGDQANGDSGDSGDTPENGDSKPTEPTAQTETAGKPNPLTKRAKK